MIIQRLCMPQFPNHILRITPSNLKWFQIRRKMANTYYHLLHKLPWKHQTKSSITSTTNSTEQTATICNLYLEWQRPTCCCNGIQPSEWYQQNENDMEILKMSNNSKQSGTPVPDRGGGRSIPISPSNALKPGGQGASVRETSLPNGLPTS